MAAISEPLASIELQVPDSDCTGRAFLPVHLLGSVDPCELATTFGREFVEENEVDRFSLLERAIAHPAVTVETYPGATPPLELHVYLRAAEISDAPIFACVLAPLDVVRELASRPPHLVMETASLQVMESGEITNASIVAAIETWMRRVWPAMRVPTLRLAGEHPGESRRGGSPVSAVLVVEVEDLSGEKPQG
jgi:hypothetical protein